MSVETPKERDRARRISKEMCECVHFNGIQHGTCKAGVTYTDVSDKSMKPYGFPCLQVHVTTCPKRQHPTLEEATAEVDGWDRAFNRVNAAMKAIRAKHGKERGLRGEMDCPSGCGGTLRYSIAAYNGHVHGQCSTEGCASWMQ